MRAIVRSTGVVLLGIIAAVLLGFSSILVSVVALAATTALVMGGTGNPLSVPPQTQEFVNGYTADANNRYIDCGPGCTVVGAVTPEEFWPVNGDADFQPVGRTGTPKPQQLHPEQRLHAHQHGPPGRHSDRRGPS